MVHFDHYKRVAIGRPRARDGDDGCILAIWPTGLSFIGVEIVLAVVGIGIGTIFPITTTAVQNAVPLAPDGHDDRRPQFLPLARRRDPRRGLRRDLPRRPRQPTPVSSRCEPSSSTAAANGHRLRPRCFAASSSPPPSRSSSSFLAMLRWRSARSAATQALRRADRATARRRATLGLRRSAGRPAASGTATACRRGRQRAEQLDRLGEAAAGVGLGADLALHPLHLLGEAAARTARGVTFRPSSSVAPKWSYCQICARLISAVAASSIRL